MIKVRAVQPSDMDEVKRLHEMYYSEFNLPDFYQMMCGFIIEDENEIVMAGGVEAIGEALLVTNRGKSGIKIGKALVEAQRACSFICQKFGIKELVAFVNNDEYARHLIQHGFEKRFQTILSMRIPNGQEKTGETIIH